MSGCEMCDPGDGCIYPYYGLAPHAHDFSRTGQMVGSTVIDPRETWPENFTEDEDAPGCGTYTHCLDCGAPKADAARSAREGE